MLVIAGFISLLSFMTYAKTILESNSTFGYDPNELLTKIFAVNATQPRAGYGLIKFQEQFGPDFVSFENQNSNPTNDKPFKFERDGESRDPNDYPYNANGYANDNFENLSHNIADDSVNNLTDSGLNSENKPIQTLKKKRRRRKPRKQYPGQASYLNPGYPVPIGSAPDPGQGFGPNYFQPGFNNHNIYRPPRGPRPSLASDALSAVTEALSSIAQNDDYQCVARLLCEAAAGGALGGSSLLESVSGLQPLLTLLSAYNGISSNPLFVFGRAAFLGMSSKNSPGSCRYAYPLCPTDPEQLVHYLNNHNGGFFRFFNAPQQGQQNLEQFYNQLSQNYGLYQPNAGVNEGHYGLLRPDTLLNHGLQQPNLYPNSYGYQQNYGLNFPYNQYNTGNAIRYKNDKEIHSNANKIGFNEEKDRIEKRIQNKPVSFLNENSNEHSSKWLFPGDDDYDNDDSSIGVQYVNYDDFQINDKRKGKTLKFPEATPTRIHNFNAEEYRQPEHAYNDYHKDSNRKTKGITFPETDNNYAYNSNKHYSIYSVYNNDNNVVFNNFKRGVVNDEDEPGVTTVYVVRGNGDPNNPEIVKLRPGEKL